MYIYNSFIKLNIIFLYSTFLLQFKKVLNLARMRTFLEVLMGTIARNPEGIDKIRWNRVNDIVNLCQTMSLD